MEVSALSLEEAWDIIIKADWQENGRPSVPTIVTDSGDGRPRSLADCKIILTSITLVIENVWVATLDRA